jgi:hypothetical protein
MNTEETEALIVAKERLYRMTEPQKNMLFVALADELKRQKANGFINRPLGKFAIRVDELPQRKNFWPWDKTKLFDLYLTDEEWRTARNALNELRNWRLSVGKGDGGTDEALLKIMKAKYRNAPER